jgi:hypothetical protein
VFSRIPFGNSLGILEFLLFGDKEIFLCGIMEKASPKDASAFRLFPGKSHNECTLAPPRLLSVFAIPHDVYGHFLFLHIFPQPMLVCSLSGASWWIFLDLGVFKTFEFFGVPRSWWLFFRR